MSIVENFNPRSHEGSDSISFDICTITAISIHAPTRGATFAASFMALFIADFNPRSHEGSDVFGRCKHIYEQNFNPRSHEGSDDWMITLKVCLSLFQSTLPRGERQVTDLADITAISISIHAPTRGATESNVELDSYERISIHAPTRGATKGHDTTGGSVNDFNPRSHEGSDPFVVWIPGHLRDFNPRSHEGSDVFKMVEKTGDFKFQSTLPRGERPEDYEIDYVALGFQSTLPRGERRW